VIDKTSRRRHRPAKNVVSEGLHNLMRRGQQRSLGAQCAFDQLPERVRSFVALELIAHDAEIHQHRSGVPDHHDGQHDDHHRRITDDKGVPPNRRRACRI
jgi:hypothetical protein